MMDVQERCTPLVEIRRWGKELGILFLITYGTLQVLYFREPRTILFALAHFFMFMVPGYFLLEHSGWDVWVRLVLCFPLGLATVVILTYYANILLSIPLVPYFFIWPVLIVAVAIFFVRKQAV